MNNDDNKEFQKKYQGTFVGVRMLKTNLLCSAFISRVRCEANVLAYIDMNLVTPSEHTTASSLNSSCPITTVRENINNVEILDIPNKQVFDALGKTWMFTRFPKRQWQKGINRDNSSIVDILEPQLDSLPKSIFYKRVEMVRNTMELSFLSNLFIPNYAPSIPEAIKEISKFSLLSRCMSRMYSLALSLENTYPYLLYRYDVPIAFFDDEKGEFKVLNEIYKQEVFDLCRRNNYAYNTK